MDRAEETRKKIRAASRPLMAFAILLGIAACASESSSQGDPNDTSGLSAPPASGDCGSLQAWVKTNAHKLPTKYDDLIRYDPPLRRAIFSQLSPEIKTHLWQEQTNRWVAAHPNPTADQRAVLRDAQSLLSPAVYAANADPALQAKLDALEKQAAAAFGKADARALFAVLGPDDTPLSYEQTVKPFQAVCQCSSVDDWCDGDTKCKAGSANCAVQASGCGWWNAKKCDGLCEI